MNRKQIIGKVRRTIYKARKLWNLPLPMPEIIFYTRGKTAGYADSAEWKLWFNERIAELNGKPFGQIVIHEVAHLVTDVLHPNKTPHCKEFKMIDRTLGGDGFVYHDLKTDYDDTSGSRESLRRNAKTIQNDPSTP